MSKEQGARSKESSWGSMNKSLVNDRFAEHKTLAADIQGENMGFPIHVEHWTRDTIKVREVSTKTRVPDTKNRKQEERVGSMVCLFVCYLVDQDAQKSSHCQEGKDAQYELQSHALFGTLPFSLLRL